MAFTPRALEAAKVGAPSDFVTSISVLNTGGATTVVGTPTVTVTRVDDSGYVLECYGATVPTDADAGYQKGATFRKTNGGVATTLYINEGTSSSADFNAIESSASTVTGVVAGAGMTGGGTEGTVTLNVIGSTGITVNADSVQLATGYTPSHIIKFAGQPTTVGGNATEAFSVAGIAGTDLAFVQIVNDGTNNRTALAAVCTTNTLTVTFSGDPGNDLVFNYQIVRAVA